MPPARARGVAAVTLAACLAVGAAACRPVPAVHDLQVYVSFGPLAYLVERIGGSEAEITTLVAAGADPHSAELSPADVGRLAEADLLVYVSGLQPALDSAVSASPPAHVVDTAQAASAPAPTVSAPPDPALDPHFWLDPIRYGLAAEQVADALAALDPENATEFRDRADTLVEDLAALDEDYRTALTPCAGATLVTSHEAFGYLAARYGLHQVGITGIDPEVEPSPARLREVMDVVQSTGVTTIFFEVAADPAVADQLASELGVATGVLDTMERTVDPDYLAVMGSNLDALQGGLTCSADH